MVIQSQKRDKRNIEQELKRQSIVKYKHLKYKRLKQEGEDEIEYWKNKRHIIQSGKNSWGY